VPNSWSAVKYQQYDICIRFFGRPNVLFCTIADFYGCQPDKLYFPYYDCDYLLVNKIKKTFIGKIMQINVSFYTKLK
jgi:hypothetical protein